MISTELDLTEAIKKLRSVSINPIIKDINSSEYYSLKILYSLLNEPSDKKVCVSDIRNRLNISAPSVTKILNGLEIKGLIERKNDEENHRNIDVYITEEGIKVKEKADYALDDFIANVYNTVGRENIVQFLHLSKIILTAIENEIENYHLKGENI